MRRLKQLEDENGKLRKLVGDLSLDKEMLQDVIHREPRVQQALIATHCSISFRSWTAATDHTGGYQWSTADG